MISSADLIWFIVFSATFISISAISWRPILVLEEASVPGENQTMGKHLISCSFKKTYTNMRNGETTWQMSFNADKCFTLRISKKRKPKEYNYLLHNQVLEVTKDSKYLCVIISNDLSWANHISNITAKANHTIGFLRCNIYACPKEVKRSCINNTSEAIHWYASVVWGPLNKNQISHLDSVQRRAARFASSNFKNENQEQLHLWSPI